MGWLIWMVIGIVSGTGCAGASSLPWTDRERVDINRATAVEMMRVPGMTASWAGRIVRFRPYRTKLDLVEQGVISPEEYGRIREGVVAHRLAGVMVRGKRREVAGQDTR